MPAQSRFHALWRRSLRPAARSFARRRAAIALELVLVLPVLVLLVVVTIQFGLFHANMQEVALAARVGAEEASQTESLPNTDGDPVPANVLLAINKQLHSSRIRSCCVKLEHNVDGNPVVLVSPNSDACAVGPIWQPIEGPLPGTFVRVSIFVPKSAVMPNSSRLLGLDVSDPSKVVGSCAAFRYELQP